MNQAGRAHRRRLVVQMSFPDPRPTTNPYIVMLQDAVAAVPGVELRTFSLRRALLGRYDVFHVHWPEILVRRSSPAKSLVWQLLTAVLLLKLRLVRIPVVRTVHDPTPYEAVNRRQAWLLRAFDRLTTLRIRINPTTPVPPGAEVVTIVHGHYRDWFARYPARAARPGRFGYVGLIRRYKRVDRLLTAFHQLDGPYSLRIAGKPAELELAAEVRALVAQDDRVQAHLAYVDDAELVELVGESELVVLPYGEMHNSGVVLSVLSLGRPVLVPSNPVNALLADEVGPGWIHAYEGELTAQVLADALSQLRADPPAAAPDLSAREWRNAGEAHVAAYRRAISIGRSPGRAYSK